MGSLRAAEMAGAAASGELSLGQALEYHVRVNHYPPLPYSMVPVCQRAIALAAVGEVEQELPLPEEVRYRGTGLVPVWALIESYHLEAFVAAAEGEDEGEGPGCGATK